MPIDNYKQVYIIIVSKSKYKEKNMIKAKSRINPEKIRLQEMFKRHQAEARYHVSILRFVINLIAKEQQYVS